MKPAIIPRLVAIAAAIALAVPTDVLFIGDGASGWSLQNS
jgi:hypothetical protein